MLKRVPFKRKVDRPAARGRQWEGGPITPRAPAPPIASRVAELVEPIDKEIALQDERYMNLVRAMACAHCGRPPRSQFCHRDQGKPKGKKTDCRQGWPGCGDDLMRNRIGCHTLVCSSGKFTKEQRRLLEDRYAAQTRAEIIRRGLWPATLPRWKESS